MDGAQRAACRLRDMWEAAGQEPVKSLEFSRSIGTEYANAATMLGIAAHEGLVKNLGGSKGWIPILPEAN